MVGISSLLRALCVLGCLQVLVVGGAAADTAYLQLHGSEAYCTNDDTILAGTYPLQYTNGISTIVSSASTAISDITYTLGADNMGHVIDIDESQYATRNSTHITWVFPKSVVVKIHDYHYAGIKTDAYSLQHIPMTLSRTMNQTQFSKEDYQQASFTISFDNITYAYEDKLCDTIWTGINADENMDLNATLLLDTVSTDAPGYFYNPRSHEIEFNWDTSEIVLNRVYTFSAVIKVVPNGTSPVIFKPYFSAYLFNDTAYRNSGTSGFSTTMPGDMLPPHLTYAGASQNISLTWGHFLEYGKGANMNEIIERGDDTGVFRHGQWILDNGMDGTVNRRFNYGLATDTPVIGDFNNDGTTDIGVFRSGQWILDYGMDGSVNRRFNYGLATDIPLVGDFNKDGTTDIGVFRSGQWILDYGMDGTVNRRFNYGLPTDKPLVGDFNNDGTTDIGVFRAGQWILDYGMDGTVNRRFNYGLATDTPVTGDFNNDGTLDSGVFRAGQWILDYGMDRTVNRRFNYGLATDIPVVGKWA